MLHKFKRTIALVGLALIGGIIGGYIFTLRSSHDIHTSISDKNSLLKENLHLASLNTPETSLPDFTTAAEMSIHAVVHIKTTFNSQGFGQDPFQQFFGNPYAQRKQQGSGSGVIVTEDGFIVTNNHVVDNAEDIEVTLNDNRTFSAKIIGTDPSTDLALLKIDESGLPIMKYGNSDNLKVGEWVLAVGNPFNLTSTVTAGIVSAKARNIGILPDQFKIESFIQTDAAVNPGNSGGALVNTNGELVGINTAIASSTGSYTGYSFAIPVNIVKKVIDDLNEFGTVQRGFIGVSIRDIDSKLAEEKGISRIKGVYIAGLTPSGAASEAGLKEGDIITKVHDIEVNSTSQLQEQIGLHRPGDKVVITYQRDGKNLLTSVVLRNKEGNISLVKSASTASMLGATFEEVNDDTKAKLSLKWGVKISKLESGKLQNAGIKEGFIITQIDKKPIYSIKDIESLLKNKQGGVLIEGVYPNGLKAYYGFGI